MVESGNPKAIGWLSSIIAIIMALLLLHTFPLMGNWIDKQRAGEGKYQFDEDLCFDIDKVEQFDNSWQKGGASGTGAFVWTYFGPASGEQHNSMALLSFPLNDTVDGYGVTTAFPKVGDVPNPISGPQQVAISFNLTKKSIIEDDVTRIDVYIDIVGATFSTGTLLFINQQGSIVVLSKTVSLGNVTKIKITVANILKINTMSASDKLRVDLVFPANSGIAPGSAVVFDMQFYCIEEIKAPTLTRLAGWMSLMNIGILLFVFISFPQVQVLGRFDGLGERLKKI